MDEHRIAIVGSREYPHLDLVAEHVFLIARLDSDATIISGGARGVDRQAERSARALGIPIVVHSPDYEHHGQRAPLVRNAAIVDDSTEVWAFWDGVSRGTIHTVGLARRAGKHVQVFGPDGRIVEVAA